MDLSKEEPSAEDKQGVNNCRTARCSEKSPGLEENTSHDGQESDGTIFLTDRQHKHANLGNVNKNQNEGIEIYVCLYLAMLYRPGEWFCKSASRSSFRCCEHTRSSFHCARCVVLRWPCTFIYRRQFQTTHKAQGTEDELYD